MRYSPQRTWRKLNKARARRLRRRENLNRKGSRNHQRLRNSKRTINAISVREVARKLKW
jgi:hypothetical protein